MSETDYTRYHRQMILDDFGREGQDKLKNAKVLIAGTGGLGCPAALYLAAAGVGRLTLVDRDEVDLTNLNRQILHWEGDVGRSKVQSAVEKLGRLNSEIELDARRMTIDADNAAELVQGHDLVVDAMDNFAVRKLISRACVAQGTPFLYGGVFGLTGMTSTFHSPKTACFECIFPGEPPKVVFPVLGATPALIASIQVTEAVKVLVGLGKPLYNRLLVYNGEEMTFNDVEIEPNPDCPICGGLRDQDKA